jgi:hypothetical protein
MFGLMRGPLFVLVVMDCAGGAGHNGCADSRGCHPSSSHFSSRSWHINLLNFCVWFNH